MRRYLVLSLSAANLFFLSAWLDLQRFRAESPREVRSEAAVAMWAATLGSVLTMAAAMACAVWLIRRSGKKWLWTAAQCGFLVLLITPLEELAWQAYSVLRGSVPDAVLVTAWSLLLVVPLAGCVLNAVSGRKGVLRAAGGLASVLAPLLPLVVLDYGRAYWSAPAMTVQARSKSPGRAPERRVVWLVFDELDQRLAFEARPTSVELPELDRLRATSFYATNARSPAWDTPESMTSLLTGRRVGKFDPSLLRDTPTIFTRSGGASSVVGWHLPYCAAIGHTLASCSEPTPAVLRPATIEGALARLWKDQYERHWLVTRISSEGQFRTPWFGWGELRDQLAGFRFLRDRAVAAAADTSVSLVLLHLPIPHPHGIYDRRRNELSLARGNNYLDNLELADRTLGDIRAALRTAGIERNTILLVTSDHPWRPDVWSKDASFTGEERELAKAGRTDRIPFLVHFPGAARQLIYSRRLDTAGDRGPDPGHAGRRSRDPERNAAWMKRRPI